MLDESTKEHLRYLVDKLSEHAFDLSNTIEENSNDQQWDTIQDTLNRLETRIIEVEKYLDYL